MELMQQCLTRVAHLAGQVRWTRQAGQVRLDEVIMLDQVQLDEVGGSRDSILPK